MHSFLPSMSIILCSISHSPKYVPEEYMTLLLGSFPLLGFGNDSALRLQSKPPCSLDTESTSGTFSIPLHYPQMSTASESQSDKPRAFSHSTEQKK
uniref:Uncharacterized protein n=1 Tax=Anguilla anguilla TaxID=7936 RepID=A0A0E9WC41_ANGAN